MSTITRRPIYREISRLLVAIDNCVKSNNTEWVKKHTDNIYAIMKKYAPSGNGIDNGTMFDIVGSKPDKLIFNCAYHHMDENGIYDGWTDHDVIVTPSLAFQYDLHITGRNRNQIKNYLQDEFTCFLDTEIDII